MIAEALLLAIIMLIITVGMNKTIVRVDRIYNYLLHHDKKFKEYIDTCKK